MRKDLTIYSLAIILGFVMGLFTCKTCTDPAPAAPPAKADTVKVLVRDSIKVPVPTPVRITVPTLAAGKAPAVIYKPVPVYMPADTAALIEQYKSLYAAYVERKDYAMTLPFGGDTLHWTGVVQGNDLWDFRADLAHVDKVLTVRPKARNQVWWGASGYYRSGEIGVGSALMFVHKKGLAVEAGASIGTQGIPTYSGGVKWKIGKRY